MFVRNTDSDYKVMELDKSTGNDETRKAYRAMALKYHPDRVASLGVKYQKQAQEKLQ